MGILNNFDENFSDIKGNLKDITSVIVSESKKLKDIAKLKYDLALERKKLNDLYKDLGKYHYMLKIGEGMTLNLDEHYEKIENSRNKIYRMELSLRLDVSRDNYHNEDTGLYIMDERKND